MSTFDINNFTRNKSICIEASAGTGKTYTVQMIVAKLLKENREDLSLKNILIVTFTEKAAGELRDRIRSKMRDENLLDQLALVDNAPIYTIHSFCKQTLDEFSFEARQSEGLSMIDESAAAEFIEGWIRDELSNDIYFQKYHELTNGGVISAGYFAKKVKAYYLDYNWQEVPEIAHIDKTVTAEDLDAYMGFPEDEVKRLKEALDSKEFNLSELDFLLAFADELEKGQGTASSVSQGAYEEAGTFIARLGELQGEVDAALKQRFSRDKERLLAFCDSTLKKVNDPANSDIIWIPLTDSGFPLNVFGSNPSQKQHDLCSYFTGIKKRIKSLLAVKGVENQLKIYLEQTYVPVLYRKWQQFKSDSKLQSFDDMIRSVREAVCEDNSKLKAALKSKYKYAIIDEFQDTNQKQWDIFKSIFMEDDEHSICVVGDPKQSIYAFQGADVNVYSKAIQEISDGNADLPYSLSKNYRSTNSMIDFCNAFFSARDNHYFGTDTIRFTESNPPDAGMEKPDASYENAAVCPVWIPEKTDDEPVTEEEFAEFAVQQIIDCCTKDSDGKTKLQVYKKIGDEVKLSNVSFKDFAVLCRVQGEMKPIKQIFAKSGIPYNHYKERNLFGGKECRDWIALYSAINAPDFSSYNRKILNECLFSSFFDIPFDCLGDPSFDKPDNLERIKIMGWKKTAKERKWALLLEQIYADSEVEARLSKLDKLTNLTKLRQIGDYAVSYLYRNNCSLGELIDHLILLSKAIADTEVDEGELVEKGTDFDTVKIMTIHASKGLEFPVVIAPAGLKINPLSVSSELQRIFYVAYTRASSIMMLPWHATKRLGFLNEVYQDSRWNDPSHPRLRIIDFDHDTFNVDDNKTAVRDILENGSSSACNSEPEKNAQLADLSALADWVPNLETDKLSYSKLSHGKKTEAVEAENGTDHLRNRDSLKEDDNSMFDTNARLVPCSYDEENCMEIGREYPKGNKLGEAVHQIFEEAAFKRIGSLSEDSVSGDKKLSGLIMRKFKGQQIKIDDEDSKKILSTTCNIVWNTLNARLPEIKGNHATGGSFSLKELEDREHLAEVEFNMNPDIKRNTDFMRDYFTGFIDLLFVREKDGQKIYSILDWKTDSMNSDAYVDEDVVKKHTDKAYSIQRVLYSYCLIKWLKQFNSGKDEQWIFDNLFGGIYYVYVRGCKAGTGNGLYAQTWQSWADLKAAFDNIVDVKIPEGSN